MKRSISLIIAAIVALSLVGAFADRRTSYQRAVVSAVWVEVGDGGGTGVFVGERLILTASHVVRGEKIIRAHSPRLEGGTVASSPARYKQGMACVVIACDPARDLALLRVEGTGKPMAMAREEPAPGDPLFSIGCGDGTSLFGFAGGHVRQVYHAEYPRQNGTFSARVIDMSVPVQLGDSGGPVVDSRGDVVGIISGIDVFKNQSYLAVSAWEIRAFLNSCPGR
jgi:serine protease Do